DDVPASAAPRPLPGLSFLVPEPEDLEDLYSRYKKLQQELEFLEVQEEYIKDEQRNLKKEFLHAQEEVKRIQSIPLVIGQFLEAVDQNTAIVGSTTGSNYYVRILSTIDRELLKPNASVALHKHSNALVDVLPPEADSSIMMLTSGELTWPHLGAVKPRFGVGKRCLRSSKVKWGHKNSMEVIKSKLGSSKANWGHLGVMRGGVELCWGQQVSPGHTWDP
ncbi:26S proteasome regulatory subunit 6B-like, partial [Pyrgilauda ruficollis]|uniref:26S proteasome regulatory subunit 6B-like n=1 Tax=Pyrgilauda ruficollis TaxID=221976 RepID=UPI001B87EC06